ncbi:Cephalosporin-C deacetylase [Planctomycetes bacterium Pan216]|uniref:Cephalosporin-C deacetylase n=1 Tax=Kolteria novifilia TaxID=2527975 RepID=A0A518B407_9BACT|nr:Cephalosporin-C deacetylase [Planctomycetes bacterium Pan216]
MEESSSKIRSTWNVDIGVKPKLNRPPDFTTFWVRTTQALDGVDPALERRGRPSPSRTPIRHESLTFSSLGSVRIGGYLLEWEDDKRRPLVVHSHGYGSQCAARWDWARRGVNVLGVDIRGFGVSESAVPKRSRWGYVLTGIESPERSVVRGAVCDYLRAVEVADELVGDRTSRRLLHGVSFAGGLAVMAQGLLRYADLLALGVPTFGWAEGRQFFVRTGSGAEINRFLQERPEATEDTMVVLRYFDPMNFAPLVKCPTLLGVGLEDDVVPADTVYPIAHHLDGPLELMQFPVSHSDRPEEKLWKQFEDRWLGMALSGVPEGFGKGSPAAE